MGYIALREEKKNHIRSQSDPKEHLENFSNFSSIKILDKIETVYYLNTINSTYEKHTVNSLPNSFLKLKLPL